MKRGTEAGWGPRTPLPLSHAMSSRKGREVRAPFSTLLIKDSGPSGHSVPIQPLPHDTAALPLGRRPFAGRLRHSGASPTLQGMETTAVVQLRNPAQPPTGPVPATGSQEELFMPAGHWGGVDAGGWSQARLCDHIVWKGADRRAVQGRCHCSLSGGLWG